MVVAQLRSLTDDYKLAMSRFPGGVTIVTAESSTGELLGLTLSAFCSVAADPPTVMVSISHDSNTLPGLLGRGRFTVNVLSAEAVDLAVRFAGKGDDKFVGLDWDELSDGYGPAFRAPLSVAVLACDVAEVVDVADHALVIGSVRDVRVGDEHCEPVVYMNRAFGVVRPAAAA